MVDEKDGVGLGGGSNMTAKMIWKTILSGNQTRQRSNLKFKKKKKLKRGAKSLTGRGLGLKKKTDSSQFGSMDSFVSRGKGNSLGSSFSQCS